MSTNSTIITRAEVKKHRHRNNLWMIIHDEVYDVSKFVDEHPGGEDTLLDAAGTDASQAFEDVGHSEDARELLKQYKIGILPDDEKSKQPVPVCVLTGKGSKSTRFVVPPDKCDEVPTSTAAASKVVCDKDDRVPPKTKKRKKSNWKWLALAALLIGAIAVGAMVVKKNS